MTSPDSSAASSTNRCDLKIRRPSGIKTSARRGVALFATVMALAGVLAVAPIATTAAFAATTTNFTTPGNATYTVPAGVTAIQIDAFGAQGNGPEYGNGSPGSGGAVRTVIPVTPGQVLQMVVGQQGAGGQQGPNNYVDGGNGGGASDVRTGACAATTTCALSDRIVVAGGGGGTGGWTEGYGNNNVYCGGGGGANPDGSGAAGCDGRAQAAHTNGGGGGGTQTAGGAGGSSDRGSAPSGTFGLGGNGGGTSTTWPPGGGGGNGYYGGGGGGANGYYLGGGGGGGSSYITPSALAAEFRGATRSGSGAITVTTLDATATSTTTVTSSPNPVSASSPVTFTATVNPASAAGTVTFTAGGAAIDGCVNVAVTTNTASCTTPFQTIGARSIRAGFSGTASVLPSQSVALSQGVFQAATTTVTTSSAASISTGAVLTYTATVTPTPTGGTVTFRSSGTAIPECTNVAMNGATATCSQTYTSTGNRAITSVFSGNADYATSTSVTFNQTVVGAATTSTIVSDANPSGLGRNVTYTVTVQPAPDAGTISFTDNASTMTGCSAVAVNATSGVATCRTSYTTAGSHTIVASFSGTSNYAASSTTLTQTATAGAAAYTTPGTQLYTVPAGVTAIEVIVWGAQGNNAEFGNGSPGTGGGAKAVLTVAPGQVIQVAVGQQGGGGQQGPNNYYDAGNGGGASDIRTGACAATASCALIDRVVVGGGGGGAGAWTTGYGNNNVYCGGNGGGNPDGSGMAGCDGRAQAAHTNGGGGGGTQTAGGAGGSSDRGAAPSGTFGLGGNGGGTSTTWPPGGGGGNGYYGGGGGGANGYYLGGGGGGGSSYITPTALSEQYMSGRTGHGSVTITAIAGATSTSTTLTAAPNPATASQTITYTAVVTPAPGSGTILFAADGGPIAGCGAVAVSAGTASCTTSFRTIGNRSVRAGFSGTPTSLPSRSAAVTQTVNRASSATVVTSSAASVPNGAPVTYTASIAPIPTGGSVTFRSGGVDIASCVAVGVNTSTGIATCTQTYTSSGNRSITAVFSGNTDYATSTSAAITQAVTAATTTITVVTDQTPSGTGRGVTYTATVTSPPDGGTARFVDDGVTIPACAAVVVNTTTGVATCSTIYTSAASHAISAVFSGTANYGTSTSPALTQVVSPGAATYQSSGSQTYKVPAGWTDIRIEAWGAEGNGPEFGNGTPGKGGGIRATLPVTGGQVLQVSAGQRGAGGQQGPNNYLDGGNGGGATDVRTGACAATSTCTLADRAIVAGGGGGTGGWTTGYGNNNVYCGGNGGANPDGSGAAGCDGRAQAAHTNGGGGGGTQTAGGGGGQSDSGSSTGGTLGVGGNGGGTSSTYPPGGGGGNGYYGGGGGGGGYYLGGGGGGGSSYITPSASTAAFLGSSRTGNGVVTISHAATKISISAPTTSLTNATTRTLTATITDTGGTTVTTGPDSTLTVTFTQTSGTGSVSGLGTAVAVGGVATLIVTGANPGPVSLAATATTVVSALTTTASASFTVVQANQTITFTQPASPATYGTTFTVAPTASTGLTVTLTAAGGCTVTPVGGQWNVQMTSGTTSCTLTASQAGNTGTSAAADVVRVVAAAKATQTITFTQPATPATYGTTFQVAPTASSGLTAVVSATGGCTVSANTVTITSGTTACTLTTAQAGSGNWSAASPVERVVASAKAAQAAVTLTAPAAAFYGNTISMTAAGGSGSGTWTFSVDAGSTCTETTQTATTIDVRITAGNGTCTVTAVKAADGNYQQATAAATTTAARATLSVHAAARSKIYGDAEPAFVWTYSGFVAPDTATVVSGAASCTRDSGEDTGSYTIVCAPGSLTAANYTLITGTSSTLTINPRALTITASDASMSYLGAVPAITANYGELFNGDTTIDVAPTCSTDATSTSQVGTYISSCADASDPNYTINYSAGVVTVGMIAQPAVVLTAATTAIYADVVTMTASGGAGNGAWTFTIAPGSVCIEDSRTATTINVVITAGNGACDVTAAHAADRNYQMATTAATTTAEPAVLHVNAAPRSKTYGATDPTLGWNITGFVDDADVSGGGACTLDPGENTGSYTIVCTPGTLAADNYVFATGAPSTFTINPRILTITASDASMTYLGAVPAITADYVGLAFGETAPATPPTCSTDATATSATPAGTYTSTCVGAADPNYAITYVAGVVTIGKATQAVTIDTAPASAVFAETFPVTASATSGYPVTLVVSGGCTAATAGIGWDVTMTSGTTPCTLTASQAGGHDFTAAADATVDVTATLRDQMITWSGPPTSAVFADAFVVTASTSSGLIVGLSAAGGCSSARTATGSVSTWDVTMTSGTTPCTLTVAQGGNTNYAAATSDTNVVAAVLHAQTITFAEPSSPAVFDSTFAVAASSDSGLPVAMTASGGCELESTSTGATSTWEVTMTSGTTACVLTAAQTGNANFDPATNVTWTVAAVKADQVPLVISGPTSGIYGDTFTYTAVGGSGTGVHTFSVAGTACALDTSDETSAEVTVVDADSTCTITVTAATDDNYRVTSDSIVLSGVPRLLDVDSVDTAKVYGHADPVFAWTFSGYAAGDDASTLAETGAADCSRTAGEDVGSYSILCEPGTLAADNYTFVAGGDGELTISRRTLTVTASDITMTYTSDVPVVTASYTGFAPGDTATATGAVCTTTATATSPVGSYTTSCAGAADPNYTIAYVPGSAEITKAAQAITFDQPLSPAELLTSFQVAPSASSDLPVTVTAAGGCIVKESSSGWTVTTSSATEACVLTATQAGGANYTAATSATRTVQTAVPADAPSAPGAGQLAPGAVTFSAPDGTTSPVSVQSGAGTLTLTAGTFTLTITGQLGPDNDQVHPGSVISVTGSGVTPGSDLDVWLFSNPVRLGMMTADSSGAFSGTFTIPDGFDLGWHTLHIDAVLVDGSVRAVDVGIEAVTSPVPDAQVPDVPVPDAPVPDVSAPTTVPSPPVGDLPTTGSDPATILLFALLVVAAGAVAVLCRRHRRVDVPGA